jgi:hypothetical protein
MGSDEMVIRNTYFVQALNEILAIAATPIQQISASTSERFISENAAAWDRQDARPAGSGAGFSATLGRDYECETDASRTATRVSVLIISGLSRCDENKVYLYNSQLRHKPSIEVLQNGEEGT